jgi:purine-binding chemotaxis protein CheW
VSAADDGDRVTRLRAAFDRAFAEAPAVEIDAREDILAFRVGGDAHAVRLKDTAGIFYDHPVTPLPSPLPELLGLSGFRGQMVPVYDLASLLGYPRPATARWIMLSAGVTPVGLACEAFETLLRVSRSALDAEAGARDAELLQTAEGTRILLDLGKLLGTLRARLERARER